MPLVMGCRGTCSGGTVGHRFFSISRDTSECRVETPLTKAEFLTAATVMEKFSWWLSGWTRPLAMKSCSEILNSFR